MSENPTRDEWVEDQGVLAQLGAALFKQPTRIEVSLPRSLAEAAVRAWRRNEDENDQSGVETQAEKVIRHRAGTLALIGLAVETCGRVEADLVVVELDSWFVGDALGAAEEAGLISP